MIETKVAKVFLDQNDFCRIDLNPAGNKVFTTQLATEIITAVQRVCSDRPRKIITDVRGVRGFVPAKTRELISNHPEMQKNRLAEAFIIDSLANKVVVSMYIQHNQPLAPTKTFTEEKDAIEWLNGLDL